mmetsp:Transcript_52196/g.135359  ORF Transcript_52196/g.135359 Transcript_52196/m.135359 type:complete len:82 (+) Transcript_52196:77-322(+)
METAPSSLGCNRRCTYRGMSRWSRNVVSQPMAMLTGMRATWSLEEALRARARCLDGTLRLVPRPERDRRQVWPVRAAAALC